MRNSIGGGRPGGPAEPSGVSGIAAAGVAGVVGLYLIAGAVIQILAVRDEVLPVDVGHYLIARWAVAGFVGVAWVAGALLLGLRTVIGQVLVICLAVVLTGYGLIQVGLLGNGSIFVLSVPVAAGLLAASRPTSRWTVSRGA